jgi:hypothetical protein
METAFGDQSVMMYEQLFQVRPQKVKGKASGEVDPITEKHITESAGFAMSLRKQGAPATVKQAITKGAGFRLVDMDSFLVGLNDTTLYWMGNELRASTCALCFSELSVADTAVAITKHNPESPLIGSNMNLMQLVSRYRISRVLLRSLIQRRRMSWNVLWFDLGDNLRHKINCRMT